MTDLTGGALIGVIIAIVIGVALVSWLSFLCHLYCYYALSAEDRPQQAFDASQNDTYHMACIKCNLDILHYCCPHLDTKTARLFSDKEILVSTGSRGGQGVAVTTVPLMLSMPDDDHFV